MMERETFVGSVREILEVCTTDILLRREMKKMRESRNKTEKLEVVGTGTVVVVVGR